MVRDQSQVRNNMADNKDLVKKLSLLDEDGLKAMDEHSRQSRAWVLEQDMFFLRGNYELEPKLDEIGHTNPEDDMVVANNNISGLVRAPKFGVKHLR